MLKVFDASSNSDMHSTHHRLRWMTILYSLLVFMWSSLEDRHILPVIVLGGWGAILFIAFIHRSAAPGISGRVALLRSFGYGCAAGLSTSVITVVLMIFKNIRHAHLFPDFSAALLGEILQRAPAWTLAGGLLGLSLAFLRLAARTTES